MSTAPEHCAVCGREQPDGEQWNMFVERMKDDRHAICSTECLLTWTEGKAQDSPGIFE